MPERDNLREKIIAKIEEYAYKLGKQSKTHSEANKQDVKKLIDSLLMIAEMIACVNDRQQEYFKSQKEDKETHLKLGFFKIRKTSFVIVLLGLQVFFQTLFSMKQQNNYTLLVNEYQKQTAPCEDCMTSLENNEIHLDKQQNQ